MEGIVGLSALLFIEEDERDQQFKFRMWKAKKMLTLANKGLHAARFHLTAWRRNAVAAREDLVRAMFGAGRSIIDTGLAMVAHMDAEETDANRTEWQHYRDCHRTIRRKWALRKERWSRMYQGRD